MKETFPGTPLYSTSIDAGYSYTKYALIVQPQYPMFYYSLV